MIKICHFSSAHRGQDIRIFRKECASLSKAGFTTFLVINATQNDVSAAKEAGITLIPLEYVPESERYRRMFRHARLCYEIARDIDADIYHFHDPELIPYGLLLTWKGKKVIYDAHEDLPGSIMSKHWISKFLRRFVAKASEIVEHFAAGKLSAVISATPYIGGTFRHHARRVEVINNYPIWGELESRSTGNTDRSKVCYIGGVDRIRGICEVVDAMYLAKTELMLAGPIEQELKLDLQGKQGWAYVLDQGVVDRLRVSEILEQSFAGIVTFLPEPNHINAQPNKMFEYMSAGVPVIGSNFPLWIDVIEGNQCGICVDPKDPQQIADAINYLRTHPDEVTRMGENGRRAVREKYNWDSESVKLIQLYHQLSISK